MILQWLSSLYPVQVIPAFLAVPEVCDQVAVLLALFIQPSVPEITKGLLTRALVSIPDLFSDAENRQCQQSCQPCEEIGHSLVV